MDEAERCHKLAYIAYGELLAEGTAQEVVAAQGLSTWTLSGTRLTELSDRLLAMPGVEQTVVFGPSLHVSGRDHATLAATVAEVGKDPSLEIREIATGLEDVFVFLMSRTPERSDDKG
jgi:ABC-2 type transport system ATP-binding protein